MNHFWYEKNDLVGQKLYEYNEVAAYKSKKAKEGYIFYRGIMRNTIPHIPIVINISRKYAAIENKITLKLKITLISSGRKNAILSNPPTTVKETVKLSDKQEIVVKKLSKICKSNQYSTTLLDGVPGSGKTEIYFEIVLRNQELPKLEDCLIAQPKMLPSSRTGRKKITIRTLAESLASCTSKTTTTAAGIR